MLGLKVLSFTLGDFLVTKKYGRENRTNWYEISEPTSSIGAKYLVIQDSNGTWCLKTPSGLILETSLKHHVLFDRFRPKEEKEIKLEEECGNVE